MLSFVPCLPLKDHKDQLSNNKKKQVIRPEKWGFFSNKLPTRPSKKKKNSQKIKGE